MYFFNHVRRTGFLIFVAHLFSLLFLNQHFYVSCHFVSPEIASPGSNIQTIKLCTTIELQNSQEIKERKFLNTVDFVNALQTVVNWMKEFINVFFFIVSVVQSCKGLLIFVAHLISLLFFNQHFQVSCHFVSPKIACSGSNIFQIIKL